MCNERRDSGAGQPNKTIMDHPKLTPPISLELTGHAEAGFAPVEGAAWLGQRLERIRLGEGSPRVHPNGLENTPSGATSAHGYSNQDPGTQNATLVVVSQWPNARDWSQADVLQWLRHVLGPTPEDVFQQLGSPSGAVLCTLTKKEIKRRVGDTTGALVHDKFLDWADITGTEASYRPSDDPAFATLSGNIVLDLDTQTRTLVDGPQLLSPRVWSQADVLQWLRHVLGPTPEDVFRRLGSPSGAVLCTLTKKEIKRRVGDTTGALVHDKLLDVFAPPPPAGCNLPLPDSGTVPLLHNSNENDQFSRPYPVEGPTALGSGVGDQEVLEGRSVAPTLAPSTAPVPMDTAATSEATPTRPPHSGGRPRRPHGTPPRPRARRVPKARGPAGTSGKGSVWKFILNLLLKPRYNPSIIRWADMERGLFFIANGQEVARLRGEETQNPNKKYQYEYIARAMRSKNGYFAKCEEEEEEGNVGRKFFYFGPKARWREEMARILAGREGRDPAGPAAL